MIKTLLFITLFLPFEVLCQVQLTYSEFTIYKENIRELEVISEEDAQEIASNNKDFFYNPFKHQLYFQVITKNDLVVKGNIVFEDDFNKKITAKWTIDNMKLVEGQFINGEPVGKWTFYDKKGELIKSIQFIDDNKLPFITENYLVTLQILDGDTVINGGNGMYTTYWSDSTVHSKGKLQQGLKHDKWEGFYPEGNKMYIEQYESGNLIMGESYDKVGNKYIYDSLVINAVPAIGEAQYYETIENMLNYPEIAREKRIEGIIYLNMIVNKDGSLNDVRVIQGIGFGCDEEAIKVVRNGPEWQPAKVRGQPVRFSMVLPIKFSL